jgi:hypothetical protein
VSLVPRPLPAHSPPLLSHVPHALYDQAAAVLLPHFIHTSPDRPLWEANPMDAQTIVRAHLDIAAKPLLRCVCVCV